MVLVAVTCVVTCLLNLGRLWQRLGNSAITHIHPEFKMLIESHVVHLGKKDPPAGTLVPMKCDSSNDMYQVYGKHDLADVILKK